MPLLSYFLSLYDVILLNCIFIHENSREKNNQNSQEKKNYFSVFQNTLISH